MVLYKSSGIHEYMWLSEYFFSLPLLLLWNGHSVSLKAGVIWTVREGQYLAFLNGFHPTSPAEAGPPKHLDAAVGIVIWKAVES